MKKRAIIGLLTDYGTADSYVAAVKGVLLARLPAARIIDITHAVPPGDIRTAAYHLWSVHGYFPRGSIFIAVVDPGVGSGRALCCTRADGSYYFHPDNGILDLVLADARTARSVALTNRRYWLSDVSATFHGRDILAPAAAALGRGTPMRSLGVAHRTLRPCMFFQPVARRRRGRYTGEILHIDQFGNIVTNFRITGTLEPHMTLSLGRTTISSSYTHYAAAAPAIPFLLKGSGRLLEISLREGSAAKRLRASVGSPVTLTVGGSAR